MRSFTLVDTLGTLKACLALLPFMFAPGYVAGWALNLFEFRQRRPILRLILAVPLSIAICPMLSYVLGRFFEPGNWAFYIAVLGASVLLLAKEASRAKLELLSRNKFSAHIWIALTLVALWGVAALGLLVDVQIGKALYPPFTAFDHSVRTAMTVAVARQSPPDNPFFANAPALLRYHYLWLLFCSLPMKAVHLSPRHVVNAGVIWCGPALMCAIALGLRFLLRARSGIERKTLIGISLLCVTGLDILPTVLVRIVWGHWLPDMEWWSQAQITSWAGSLLWVPHHVAALIACFVGFSLLRHQIDAHRRWATGPVIVAGMAFASAAGMSVYVTFTFVVAIALWLLVLAARKDWLEVMMFASAGVVALLWALPFLCTLRGPAGSDAFVEFALRPFNLGIGLAYRIGIRFETQAGLALANMLFLPLNYVLELGFFFAVGILRLRQLMQGTVRANTNELAAWTLVATSFLVGTFLRSSTIANNDLGWRCFLPAQLVLLLWAAAFVHDWWFDDSGIATQALPRSWVRRGLAILLILGLTSTGYQVFMLRVFPVLADHGVIGERPSWVVANRQFGKRAYALRSVYDTLDAQLPSSAVLQSHPATEDLILHMLYSGHDAAASAGGCGIAFGGDVNMCLSRLRKLVDLFRRPDGNDLDATCRAYGIDALVVEDSDPVWNEPSSWVWTRRPDVANDFVRAFRCSPVANGVRPPSTTLPSHAAGSIATTIPRS